MIAYLIIGLGALAVFMGSVGGAYFFGRADGKAVIQAKWDEDKAARIQRTTEIVLQQTRIRDKMDAELREARSRVEIRTVTLVQKVPVALGDVAHVQLPSAAVELFNSAVRGGETPSGPAGGADAIPAATVADLESVAIENVGRHLACVEQVLGWQQWWAEVKVSYKDSE